MVHRRMLARARSEEAQVPLQYLQQLHELHEDWLIHQTVFSSPAPVSNNYSLSILIMMSVIFFTVMFCFWISLIFFVTDCNVVGVI